MSCNVFDRNAYELEASRKRKRKSEFEDIQQRQQQQQETCLTAAATTTTPTSTTPTAIGFTNEAFSSTPKKLIARRRILAKVQTANNFIARHNLEEKSIAALVNEKTNNTDNVPANPFEVVRKPPKKKKCESKIVEACFENPALNLEMPEKQFNPYEVQRECLRPLPQCFVNEALNIKGQDVPATRNPFEIHRLTQTSETASNADGVENKAMDDQCPTKLKIGLPFTPTVGCRIDFKNISLSELTPTKLLADKLVFSPMPAAPKRSLGAISEETTMDIGRELDLYQLELENSINEAKLRRKAGLSDGEPKTKEHSLGVVTEVVEETIEVTQKITQTRTNESGQIVRRDEQVVEMRECTELSNVREPMAGLEEATSEEPPEITDEGGVRNEQITDLDEPCPNNDVAYDTDEDDLAEDFDDEVDFKAPAPFVRAYRRPMATQKAESKESLDSQHSGDGVDSKKAATKTVKSLIRSSIRKLMHPGGGGGSGGGYGGGGDHNAKPDDKGDTEKAPHNFMHTLRHSLRRKPTGKQLLIEDDETLPIQDISIIDTSERTMKFKSSQPQTEYAKIEQLTNERKHTLRNSIRRSTRDLMNTVFHKKQEEYAFCK